MKFEDWLNEVENFSTRHERLLYDLSDYQDGDFSIIERWLKAAYHVGFDAGQEEAYRSLIDDGK